MDDETVEPGPGPGDLLCCCGCGGAAFYMCEGEDIEGPFENEPACRNAMLYMADAAKELSFRFRATRFPKPPEHTCTTEETCAACTVETLRRAKTQT